MISDHLLPRRVAPLYLLLWLLVACAEPGPLLPSPSPMTTGNPAGTAISATMTRAIPVPSLTPTPSPALSPPSPTPAAAVDPGPYPAGVEARCGRLLPVVALEATPAITTIAEGGEAAPANLDAVPEAARPAVRQILEEPGSVALAAYELGQEADGVYLNADTPVPLASVVKILHLVAYAQAVEAGEVDPQTPVSLADLEQYYLPGSDLRSHPQAVAALQEEGLVNGTPPAVLLEQVPRMMIEYSSNAATDYLHDLLGQERIEQTAIELGMSKQTAPCPFLGQFLAMGKGSGALAQVQSLVDDPERYSREVMALTARYLEDAQFHEDAAWQGRQNRPPLAAQQLFSERLNAHGSAREYASLMGLIADNQLGTWEHSVRIRRYLEWPTQFPANQQYLAWLGYKGGMLPGVLTVTYYAQPWDRARPVVVSLFFHDLTEETYREWRRTLPHDELARWLLYDRDAIATLRQLIKG